MILSLLTENLCSSSNITEGDGGNGCEDSAGQPRLLDAQRKWFLSQQQSSRWLKLPLRLSVVRSMRALWWLHQALANIQTSSEPHPWSPADPVPPAATCSMGNEAVFYAVVMVSVPQFHDFLLRNKWDNTLLLQKIKRSGCLAQGSQSLQTRHHQNWCSQWYCAPDQGTLPHLSITSYRLCAVYTLSVEASCLTKDQTKSKQEIRRDLCMQAGEKKTFLTAQMLPRSRTPLPSSMTVQLPATHSLCDWLLEISSEDTSLCKPELPVSRSAGETSDMSGLSRRTHGAITDSYYERLGTARNKFIHYYHLPDLLKICLTRLLACY